MGRVPGSGAGLRRAAILLTVISCAPALADVVHLRNGGSIAADSWEQRGANLVIHQGRGTIVVPRADVTRIDREPHAGVRTEGAGQTGRTDAAAAPKARPATVPSPARGALPARPGREQVLERVRKLQRRLHDVPHERAETTRLIVRLLTYLGSEAYAGRQFDEALARLREAIEYDPHDAEAQLGLAATYLALDQDPYALSTLQSAVLDHPEDPRLLALLGDVYYREERGEEALAAWRQAQALAPDPPLKEKIEKLLRERVVDEHYDRSEAAHFTLKYDGVRAGPDLGPQILEFLESRFAELVTRIDYYPAQPIVVIVYPQRQFYEATEVDAGVGGLFDGKIRVPGGGLKGLSAEAKSALLHELAHAFVAGKSRYAAPRWLHEGIAQMIEGRTTPRSTAAALAEQYRALDRSPGWGTPSTYPSALSFVEFLARQEGFPRLMDVLDAMATGATADEAFESVTHYSLPELRQAWGEALIRNDLH